MLFWTSVLSTALAIVFVIIGWWIWKATMAKFFNKKPKKVVKSKPKAKKSKVTPTDKIE